MTAETAGDTGHDTGHDTMHEPRIHEVLEVRDEIAEVVTMRVAPVDGPPPPFLPAQVGMVGAFGVGEAALSISSDVTDRAAHEYTVRRTGAITTALHRLCPGDQLWVRGPFGTPWDLDLADRDVIVAAGGIGLAPLRSAVFELARRRHRHQRVIVVIGARDPSSLLFGRDHDSWKERGMSVVTTVDRSVAGWTGRTGYVHEVVDRVFDDFALDPGRTAALVCGPDAMMTAVATTLIDRCVAADRVQLTLERNMQCGTGLCGHCQLGPVIVCRDGPVVRYPVVANSLTVPER